MPSEYPYPIGMMPLLGNEFMYEGAIASDKELLGRLAEFDAQRPSPVEAAGYIFRNADLAGLVKENYTPEQLARLEGYLMVNQVLRTTIQDAYLESGGVRRDIRTIGATTRPTGAEMSGALWIRDQTQCAASMMEMYLTDPSRYAAEGINAKDMFLSLLTVMSTPAQITRFQKMIANGQDSKYGNNPANWPYIFFHNDNLNTQKKEGWAHKQDAWQMLVRDVVRSIETEVILPSELSDGHKQFLNLVIPFLKAVDFTTMENAGSWEEINALRTSTIAWDVAAIQSLVKLNKLKGFDFINTDGALEMVDQGLIRIESSFPNESPNYDLKDPRYRTADASLLYLLDLGIPQQLALRKFPQDTEIKQREQYAREIENTILDKVLELSDPELKLSGFARYGVSGETGDSYQGENFWTNRVQKMLSELYGTRSPTGDFSGVHHFLGRDSIVPHGRPAYWTHFIAQVSGWASRRYLETGDDNYYGIAQNFLNRVMSTVTGKGEYSIAMSGNKLLVQQIPANRIPECWVTVSDPETNQSFIFPSPNTPLNWAIQKTAEAVALFRKAVNVRYNNKANL